jgi:hypothetical protein
MVEPVAPTGSAPALEIHPVATFDSLMNDADHHDYEPGNCFTQHIESNLRHPHRMARPQGRRKAGPHDGRGQALQLL